tara:strand:- start:55 stop:435 length:381 start_codon:yes stop_codon:yes gene_type:complete
MKLNRKQLRRLIESAIYEGNNSEKFSKEDAIRIAKDLNRAMVGDPTISFLTIGLSKWGTDEERIGKLFKEMNNSVIKLVQVANFYRTIYNRTLPDHLFKELNKEERYRFIEANFDDGIQHLKDMDS